jgi:hypothetical protein
MTKQQSDLIEILGVLYHLFSCPLDSYLARLPRSRRPFTSWSTGNHRGYVAAWAVREGRLWLEDVATLISVRPPRAARIAETLPWLQPPVAATWFTGDLHCPEGRLITYATWASAARMNAIACSPSGRA